VFQDPNKWIATLELLHAGGSSRKSTAKTSSRWPKRSLTVQELAERIAPIAGAVVERTAISEMTADDWYDLALDLEGVATDRAREAYTRTIALHPGHVHAHLNLGRLLHEVGEIASAEAHYRQALSANPESPLAAFNLGVALEDLKRAGEAIEAYQRALRFEPNTAAAHYNLSRLYEEKGLTKEALRHLADYKRLI
jgi:tetratricopeptide (TPR) repeat protein